jgi:hypothetical protein
MLLLDGGNLFQSEESFQLERGLFLLRCMRKMGYHVLGVGEKDLSWGIAAYKDSVLSYGLVPVSANLVNRATHKLIFKPYAVESVNGVKVGILSVVSPQNGYAPSPFAEHKDSLDYLDVETAVRTTVAELRPKCQVLVAVLNVGNHDADALAGKIPGIDVVIVGGQAPQMIPRGTLSGTSLVVSGGIKGQYVGRTLVDLKDGKVVGTSATVTALDALYPEQDVFAGLRRKFDEELNERVAKRQREIDMAAARKRGLDHYVGREGCVNCHRTQYDSWQPSAHARAFDTLVKRRKDRVAECVSCHVTGYQEYSGYFSNVNPGIEIDGQMRRMEGVQCEACHGMGTRHNTGDPAFVNAAKASCVRCHTRQQDPKFNYDTAWAKIAH